jgi:TatD DNase family protein
MMGLHPTSVKEDNRAALDLVESELKRGHYVGIGEIGIDLYWEKKYFKQQCLAFRYQLDLAISHNLPVVIHDRESFGQILEILEDYRKSSLTGIFHAFTGSVEIANRVIEMGFRLGIGGILTYKNSGLPEVVKATDLKNMVFETDSPYLAPVPFRGKRNESSYIPYIADMVKQIKNIPLEEVAGITTGNVLDLFALDHD